MNKRQEKIGKVMSEFKSGKLTTGGKPVKNPQQAMAIALSEASKKARFKK